MGELYNDIFQRIEQEHGHPLELMAPSASPHHTPQEKIDPSKLDDETYIFAVAQNTYYTILRYEFNQVTSPYAVSRTKTLTNSIELHP